MERAVVSAQVFRFGLFEANASKNTLTRRGIRVKVQDQPFRVLILLLERPGEIISREEMRQRLWPEGTYVDFDGSLNVILKKLRAALEDDSDNPRFVETIPRRGYRFIAPVSVSSEQTSAASENAPDQLPVELPVSIPAPAEKRRSSLLLYVAAGVTLLAIGTGLLAWRWNHRNSRESGTSQSSAAPVPMRRSLAVLGFHNTSGRAGDAWLGTAFSEMLSTELGAGDRLRLVSGEDVANLRLSAPWSASDTLDRASTSRIGASLSSDLLVLGSYAIVGAPDRARLRLDVRMQDAKTGEILTEIAEIGSAADLFQVVSRVGDKLRDRLGVPSLQAIDQATILASSPMDRESARFYALGLSKAREFDWLASKDLLEQAIKGDPKFPLAHLNLAVAFARLGYGQKHKEESKRAMELSKGLPPAQRLLIEGNYYESLADHERAASTYRALFQLYPDSVEYGLLLATAQIAGSHKSQAMYTLAQLRALDAPASEDPRIDLAEVMATAENDPARLVLIRKALTKAAGQNKKLLYAQARKAECLNLIYSDHPDSATGACEDAYTIFMAAGNHLEAADTIRLMGDHQGADGHPQQAITTYQRALKILSELGEHYKTGAVLNDMAIDYANLGQVDRAEELYRQAKFHFEQAGDKALTALTIGNIADILYLRGDLPGAAKMYDESLQMEESLEHSSPGYVLYRLADLELTQGRLQDSRRDAEKALELLRANQGGYQYITSAMLVLAEIAHSQADLRDARRQFEEVLAMQQKVGEADLVAETQVELADLTIDEGHSEQAEPLLRAAIAQFEKENSAPDAASAYTILSRALLLQGKVADARKAITHVGELTASDNNPALKLPRDIQKARVEIADLTQTGAGIKSRSVEQELRTTAATAKRLGFFALECEAKLALGELDARTNPVTSRAELGALATTSRTRGFELIARRADQVAASATTALASAKPSH